MESYITQQPLYLLQKKANQKTQWAALVSFYTNITKQVESKLNNLPWSKLWATIVMPVLR